MAKGDKVKKSSTKREAPRMTWSFCPLGCKAMMRYIAEFCGLERVALGKPSYKQSVVKSRSQSPVTTPSTCTSTATSRQPSSIFVSELQSWPDRAWSDWGGTGVRGLSPTTSMLKLGQPEDRL